MDDIVCRLKNILQLSNLCIIESQLKNHILFELEKIFNKNYCSLRDCNLPIPNNIIMKELNNLSLRKQLSYNVHELEVEHQILFGNLNEGKKIIYEAILNAIEQNRDALFFCIQSGRNWQNISMANDDYKNMF